MGLRELDAQLMQGRGEGEGGPLGGSLLALERAVREYPRGGRGRVRLATKLSALEEAMATQRNRSVEKEERQVLDRLQVGVALRKALIVALECKLPLRDRSAMQRIILGDALASAVQQQGWAQICFQDCTLFHLVVCVDGDIRRCDVGGGILHLTQASEIITAQSEPSPLQSMLVKLYHAMVGRFSFVFHNTIAAKALSARDPDFKINTALIPDHIHAVQKKMMALRHTALALVYDTTTPSATPSQYCLLPHNVTGIEAFHPVLRLPATYNFQSHWPAIVSSLLQLPPSFYDVCTVHDTTRPSKIHKAATKYLYLLQRLYQGVYIVFITHAADASKALAPGRKLVQDVAHLMLQPGFGIR